MVSFRIIASAAVLLAWSAVPFGGRASAQSLLERVEFPRGYRSLDMPRDFGGLPLAGALVQITRGRGFRYIGHLRDCGLPANVLTPIPAPVGLASVSRTAIRAEGGMMGSLLRIISLELRSDAAKAVEVVLEGASDEMIVPLAVVGAARSNDAVLRERCGHVLGLNNVYWVNNALSVTGLRISLLNAAGGKMVASAAQLGSYVSGFEGRADVSVSAEGEIVVKRRMFVAFRDAPPAELLTGKIQLQSVQPSGGPIVVFGDEVYAQP